MPTEKTLRPGSVAKREAILAAARHLFLTDGYDRTSVDAVAARAAVSKRTVYDYFGDKQTLLGAVVRAAAEGLLAKVTRTMDETLAGFSSLEEALVTFSMRIATEMLRSGEYLALLRLSHDFAPHDKPVWTAPEQAMGERLAALGRAGHLAVDDPHLAADHLVALTFGVAGNRHGAEAVSDPERIRPLIVAGVRAFLKIYAPAR